MRVLLAALLAFAVALPAAAQTGQPSYGFSLFGDPLKYPPGFAHFDYVNPDAPKGGDLRLDAIGTFDTLNPFTLKGVQADGVNMVFETLMAGSLDEPFTQYGWVAESVTVAPDRSWVAYKLRPQA